MHTTIISWIITCRRQTLRRLWYPNDYASRQTSHEIFCDSAQFHIEPYHSSSCRVCLSKLTLLLFSSSTCIVPTALTSSSVLPVASMGLGAAAGLRVFALWGIVEVLLELSLEVPRFFWLVLRAEFMRCPPCWFIDDQLELRGERLLACGERPLARACFCPLSVGFHGWSFPLPKPFARSHFLSAANCFFTSAAAYFFTEAAILPRFFASWSSFSAFSICVWRLGQRNTGTNLYWCTQENSISS